MMMHLMGIAFGIVALGSVVALALLLYFGCERFARRSLKRAYEGLDTHGTAVPDDVMLVYHTYHGFVIWNVQSEHRVTLPAEDARQLLGRLLRFNLTWGLIARGGILIAPLAIYNFAIQRNSILEQEAAAAFAATEPNLRALTGPGEARHRRSWFYTVFGWIAALLGGLFAISAICCLGTRQFEAGFGGVIGALLLGWTVRDWLRKSVAETP